MIPDDGLGSASKEDGEEQEMEERHWEDLWHLELDNMEDSPILEMGVKPLKTQCHQQAPETGSNISRKKHLLTSPCWRCRSFFQQPRIQRGKRCLMREGTEGLSSEGRRQGQGWEIFCITATNHLEFPNLLVMALRWRRRRAGRRVAQVPRFLMSRMELIRGKLPSCQS